MAPTRPALVPGITAFHDITRRVFPVVSGVHARGL